VLMKLCFSARSVHSIMGAMENLISNILLLFTFPPYIHPARWIDVPYDAAARQALQSVNLRQRALLRYATWAAVFQILPIVHSSRRGLGHYGRGGVAAVARVLASMLAISRPAIAAGMTAFMIWLTWPGMMTNRQMRIC
jgi:hypothetical protein